MIDMEKTALGIREMLMRDTWRDIDANRPRYQHILNDAMDLLKEQEAVEPFHKCIGKDFSLIEDSHFDYCPYCGKPITWAKQEGR